MQRYCNNLISFRLLIKNNICVILILKVGVSRLKAYSKIISLKIILNQIPWLASVELLRILKNFDLV